MKPRDPVKLIEEILALIQAKRWTAFADSSRGDYLYLNDHYKGSVAATLEAREKYSIVFPEDLLWNLFKGLKDTRGDLREKLWCFVIKLNKDPLPSPIGLELCADSYMAYHLQMAIANSQQNLDVHFAAADELEYARSRLCIRLFIDARYSSADLARFLERYGRGRALRVLEGKTPSDEGKYEAFSPSDQAYLKSFSRSAYEDPERNKKERKNSKRRTYLFERHQEEQHLEKLQMKEKEAGKSETQGESPPQ